MAKVAVTDYHVLQILFFRQVVVFATALPSIAKTFPASLKTNYPKFHLLRLSGAFIALSFDIWAISVLPLATAVTLSFAQVFFVVLLAWYFLGEPIGPRRIAAVVLGFIGVLVVMRPGVNNVLTTYALISLVAAIGAAIAITSVRKLSQTESTATLIIYQAIFVGVIAALPLPWLWTTPDLAGLILLFAIGAIASVGQWAGVTSLRLGEASVIGNIKYVQLIYVAILGFLIFGEVPDKHTIIGAAIIIGSSLFLFYRESVARRRS